VPVHGVSRAGSSCNTTPLIKCCVSEA
jgi:hypothetical protein